MATFWAFVAGLLANLTCIGSSPSNGHVPDNLAIACSASSFRSNRTNPTPLEIP